MRTLSGAAMRSETSTGAIQRHRTRRVARTFALVTAMALAIALPFATFSAVAQDNGPPNPVVNAAKTDTGKKAQAPVLGNQPQEPRKTDPGEQSRLRHSDHELALSY